MFAVSFSVSFVWRSVLSLILKVPKTKQKLVQEKSIPPSAFDPGLALTGF